MTLEQLKDRVVETLGEDVIDIDTLVAGISNGYADMTSRGYRLFKEELYDAPIQTIPGLIEVKAPSDIRKSLYLKVFFDNRSINIPRLSLANPYIRSIYTDGFYTTPLGAIGMPAIYYVKNDKFYIEYTPSLGNVRSIEFGYYAKLKAPDLSKFNAGDDVGSVELEIREEFSDAIVLFLVWYIAARNQEDGQKLSMYLNQYKYYMEDVLFELQYEDSFTAQGHIIVHEEE